MGLKVLGNTSKGKLFILSAPAGTGKTTLTRMLIGEFPQSIVESTSYTTRSPRKGEHHGKDYYFISQEEFLTKIKNQEFLEHAEVFQHHYGTCKDQVNTLLNKGKHVVLVIDTQGAMQLKKLVNAVYIFVKPPSLEELKKRLMQRQSDSIESIEKRLSWAEKEISLSSQYDYVIVNDNLDIAYEVLKSIMIAEEHKVR